MAHIETSLPSPKPRTLRPAGERAPLLWSLLGAAAVSVGLWVIILRVGASVAQRLLAH
jgi:hypothetical protein